MTNVRQLIINSPKYGQKIIFIDDEDLEKVSKYQWKINKRRHKFYAQAWVKETDQTTMMHRLIMDVTIGDSKVVIDHKDGNGLNNVKSNLRVCTNKQNCWNRGLDKNSKTGFRGVNRRGNGYIARIRVDDKLIHLKWTKDINIAVQAYNEAAIKYYGEYARLNVL